MDFPSPSFVNVGEAVHKGPRDAFNLIGMIVDFDTVGQSSRDMILTFQIRDVNYGHALKVRIFGGSLSDLPPIERTGDVVLLRRLKWVSQFGTCTLFKDGDWILFPRDKIPDVPASQFLHVTRPLHKGPTLSEFKYVQFFCKNSKIDLPGDSQFPRQLEKQMLPSSDAASSPQIVSKAPRDKFCLIQDLTYEAFRDLIGEVVKIIPVFERVELYVTDYTEHGDLLRHDSPGIGQDSDGRDGDEYNYTFTKNRKWIGPLGKRTLRVFCWPPHSVAIKNGVVVGDIISLKNVQIKDAGAEGMEGKLRTDQKYPERLYISKAQNEDARVKALLMRKAAYSAEIEGQAISMSGKTEESKKRRASADQSNHIGEKKQKKRVRRNKHNEQLPSKDTKANLASGLLLRPPNEHIRSERPQHPTSSIASILRSSAHEVDGKTKFRLPFINLKYRAEVKVVDFVPHRLEDFTVPYIPADRDEASIKRDDRVGLPKWEWCFRLVVMDGSAPDSSEAETERMELNVNNEAGECLLRLDAEDLHKNPTAVARLREKLFLLWGNLEELKNNQNKQPNPISTRNPLYSLSANPISTAVGSKTNLAGTIESSTRPFTCCIQEYGIHDDDEGDDRDEHGETDGCQEERCHAPRHWRRQFMMFGTTIM